MRQASFNLLALFATCWTLATWLLPWFNNWNGNGRQSKDILATTLGESRKLFANHFYVKADEYFHSGYYPTIFDTAKKSGSLHMAESKGGKHEEEGADFLGAPKDWIDSFSRHFYPSQHRHLGEGSEGHEGHDHAGEHEEKGQERELLPWLKLAATLDPERPETYIVASFWLRSQLGKPNEAEQFLRQGLRANPGHPEMLFELGRIFQENHHNPDRARNLWELALKRSQETTALENSTFLQGQILGHLAKLEEEEKNYSRAADYLKLLEMVSPHKMEIQKWRQELESKAKTARPAFKQQSRGVS